MDPKDNFSSKTIIFIFTLCIAAFGFVYFEIFRLTEKPPAPAASAVVK